MIIFNFITVIWIRVGLRWWDKLSWLETNLVLRICFSIVINLFWFVFCQIEVDWIDLDRFLLILRDSFRKCQVCDLLRLGRYKSRCIFRSKSFKSVWQFIHLLLDFKNLSWTLILRGLCWLNFLMNYLCFRHQRLDSFGRLVLMNWLMMKRWKISILLVTFVVEKHHRRSHLHSFRSVSPKS